MAKKRFGVGLMAAIFKFKMAAWNESAYNKVPLCQIWCFYTNLHDFVHFLPLSAGLIITLIYYNISGDLKNNEIHYVNDKNQVFSFTIDDGYYTLKSLEK
jgi:hypothetical protein